MSLHRPGPMSFHYDKKSKRSRGDLVGVAFCTTAFADVVAESLGGTSFGDALAGVLRAAVPLVLSTFPFDAIASPVVFAAAAAVLRVVILLQHLC